MSLHACLGSILGWLHAVVVDLCHLVRHVQILEAWEPPHITAQLHVCLCRSVLIKRRFIAGQELDGMFEEKS